MKGIVDRSGLIAAVVGLVCAPLALAALEALAGAIGGSAPGAASAEEAGVPLHTSQDAAPPCAALVIVARATRVDHNGYGLRLAADAPRATFDCTDKPLAAPAAFRTAAAVRGFRR